LLGVVVFAHHPAAFMAILLLFMGVATAYPAYQDRLILREGLLVGFFLGGLVVLGGMQQWWLQPTLLAMDDTQVYFGATFLTAITDNAALTYLGSLVEGLSDEFKYALVTGAVTGGGLTLIANAPNPAGASILKSAFDDGAISPLGLLAGAAAPTLVAIFLLPAVSVHGLTQSGSKMPGSPRRIPPAAGLASPIPAPRADLQPGVIRGGGTRRCGCRFRFCRLAPQKSAQPPQTLWRVWPA